jgi:hypothetical protein
MFAPAQNGAVPGDAAVAIPRGGYFALLACADSSDRSLRIIRS